MKIKLFPLLLSVCLTSCTVYEANLTELTNTEIRPIMSVEQETEQIKTEENDNQSTQENKETNEIILDEDDQKTYSKEEWYQLLISDYDYLVKGHIDNLFTPRTFIIAPMEYPWTREKIKLVLEDQHEIPEKSIYYDRTFFDVDNDGQKELVLYSEMGVIIIYSLLNDEICLMGSVGDYDLMSGNPIYPPIEQEYFGDYENDILSGTSSEWWNYIYDNCFFELVRGSDGNIYLTLFKRSTSYPRVAFIKELVYENQKFELLTRYRWGYFKEQIGGKDDNGYVWQETIYPFKYQKNISTDVSETEYVDVPVEEIQKYLDLIYANSEIYNIWDRKD